MSHSRSLALLVVCLLPLAGCVGDSGSKGVASSSGVPKGSAEVVTASSSDPNATQQGDVGRIMGNVTDEEAAPVAGVDVVIRQTDTKLQTDAAGGFVFSNVPPGKYDVIAQKLGFQSAAKSVQVVAGETAKLEFHLTSVAIVEAFNRTYTYVGQITCGIALVPFCGILQDVMGPGNPLGEVYNWEWSYENKTAPLEEVFELVWTPSVPGTAAKLDLLYFSTSKSVEGGSILRMELDQDTIKGCAKDKCSIGVYPSLTDADINQKFTLYRTEFWGEPAPEGWSHIPK